MSSDLKAKIQIDSEVKNLADIKRLTNELKETGHNVDGLENATDKLSQAWDELNPREQGQRLRRLKEACDKVADGQEVLADSIFKTGKSAESASKDVKKLEGEIGKTTPTLTKLSSAMGKVSAVLGITFVTAKITSFFSGATKGAADFEQQLATVQAVSGATVEELEKIKAASEELGKTTSFNATQAAEGFEILARAGLNTAESLKTIPSVLALAKGNGLELSEAAGFITKAVQGMGLSFDEAGRVADVLAKASASANTDVRGLGAALSYAAPSAAALGVTIEETAAYIGKFADAGIDASRAGTSFNGMLSQFSNSTSSFRRELGKIGITTDDFNQAIAELSQAGAKGQSAINALGMEAGPALKALLSQGIPSLNDLTAKLNEAGGAAQNQADIMGNTWHGVKALLDSSWQSLKKQLGEPLLSPTIDGFKRLTETITALVDSGKIKQLGESVGVVFGQATTDLIDYINKLDMSAVIDKVSVSLDYLKNISVAINGAFQILSITFNAVKSGLLTIGAVVAGNIEIYATYVRTIVDSSRIVADALGLPSKNLDGLSESLSNASQAAADFRHFAVEEIGQASDSMGKSLKSIAGDATESSQTAIAEISKIPEGINKAFAESVNSAKTVGEIDNIVNGMLELQEQGKVTSEEMATAMNWTTEKYAELEKQTDLDIKAIAKLAEESVKANDGMISDEVKHEASLRNLTTWVDDLGNVYVATAEKANQSAQGTEQSFNNMTKTAEQKAEEAKQAIGSTFETLEIDLAQKLTGVNSKTQETFDIVVNGAKNVADSAYSAADKVKILSALFEKGLNAAKTKEEFKALSDMSTKYGMTAIATAEQTKVMKDGIDGLNDKLSQSPALLSETEKALKALGIISKESATKMAQEQIDAFEIVKASGQASASELVGALKKINIQVGASGDASLQSWYKAEKAAFDMGNAVKESANTAVSAMSNATHATDKVANSLDDVANSATNATSKYKKLNAEMGKGQKLKNTHGETVSMKHYDKQGIYEKLVAKIGVNANNLDKKELNAIWSKVDEIEKGTKNLDWKKWGLSNAGYVDKMTNNFAENNRGKEWRTKEQSAREEAKVNQAIEQQQVREPAPQIIQPNLPKAVAVDIDMSKFESSFADYMKRVAELSVEEVFTKMARNNKTRARK